jgi:hypothetical protein
MTGTPVLTQGNSPLDRYGSLNQKSSAHVLRVEISGEESRPEEPVNSNTFHQAGWLHQERASRLDRTGAGTAPALAPAVGLTAAILVSLGLWWGIWSAASSLVSALW